MVVADNCHLVSGMFSPPLHRLLAKEVVLMKPHRDVVSKHTLLLLKLCLPVLATVDWRPLFANTFNIIPLGDVEEKKGVKNKIVPGSDK